MILSPVLAPPGARPRSRCRSTSWGRPRCSAKVDGRISPALLTRRWSSKAIWMRSGSLRGSIYLVLLLLGRFGVSQTIIPEAKEHFLTAATRPDTHLFGGLGLIPERDCRVEAATEQCSRLRRAAVLRRPDCHAALAMTVGLLAVTLGLLAMTLGAIRCPWPVETRMAPGVKRPYHGVSMGPRCVERTARMAQGTGTGGSNPELPDGAPVAQWA